MSHLRYHAGQSSGRGVDVSEPFHFGQRGQTPGLDPARADSNSFVSFSDPDGNGWLIQEIKQRAPAVTAASQTEDFRMSDPPRKTAIVTGASQGIGAGIGKRFVERGFNVVANSRKVTQSTEVAASNNVTAPAWATSESRKLPPKMRDGAVSLQVDRRTGQCGICHEAVHGLHQTRRLTNLEGFLYVTQLSIKTLAQKTGGSIVTITAALARHPGRHGGTHDHGRRS